MHPFDSRCTPPFCLVVVAVLSELLHFDDEFVAFPANELGKWIVDGDFYSTCSENNAGKVVF